MSIFVLYSKAELYSRPEWNDIPKERKVSCHRLVGPYVNMIIGTGYEGAPCLAYVDPYIDTIYNRLQIPAFLEQWSRLKELNLDEKDRQAVERVEQLAKICLEQKGMYLYFSSE